MGRTGRLAVLACLSLLLVLGAVYGAEVFDPGGPLSVIPGTPTYSGLTANTALHLNASKVLTADTLASGQVLCGSTGAAPAICTPAAGANLTVTLGAGTISYDTIQGIQTSSSPTFAGVNATKAVTWGRTTPTYGASVAIDASAGNVHRITATNGTAFTVANPTNGTTGQILWILVRNASGGALGVLTWDTLYKLGAAWTQPANGFSRSLEVFFDGTNWVEVNRAAADVSN